MGKLQLSEAISGKTKLPEETIQHIQSFLNGKEATRTIILSKSWYTAWLTRPNLDFSEPNIGIEIVKKTMQRYEELNLKIESFKLSMVDNSRAKEFIFKAIKLGATDLDIGGKFILPCEVFESDTLVKLSFVGGEINPRGQKVSCSRLKYLNLSEVNIGGSTFWKLISMCPSIEELNFSECDFGGNIMVGSNLGLGGIHKLRVLSLKNMEITWLFRDLSSRFPCLKELTLEGAFCFGELQIYSNSLEYINLNNIIVEKAELDVPKIRQFKFLGSYVLLMSFKKIQREREWESDISIVINADELDTTWFVELREFLFELSPSKISLCLSIRLDMWRNDNGIQDMIGLPKPPIVVENLTLVMNEPSLFRYAFLYGLLWSYRPSFVNLYRLPWCCMSRFFETSTDFTKELCKTILIRGSGEKQSMTIWYDSEKVNIDFFEYDLSLVEGHYCQGPYPLPPIEMG